MTRRATGRRGTTIAGAVGALAMLAALAVPALPAAAASTTAPSNGNVWLDRHPLNIAHAGGDLEAPHETMYAYERAVHVGADMLEMDVRLSADRQLMVIHDDTVDRTTNGTGPVASFTAAQLQALDNAYWFVPDCWSCHDRPADQYRFRGVRTGEKPPPPGYTADDFAIPTLRDIFERFPDRLLDIEIKDGPDGMAAADALAAMIHEYHRERSVVVVSFDDAILAHFKDLAPDVDTSPGLTATTNWFFAPTPLPGQTSLQVPPTYEGIQVVTPQFVETAHADGLAVYVWFNGNDDDVPATWSSLLDMGVDGFITGKPQQLQTLLEQRRDVYRTPFDVASGVGRRRGPTADVALRCPARTAARCRGLVLLLAPAPAGRWPALAGIGWADAARDTSTSVRLWLTGAGRSWLARPDGRDATLVVLPLDADTGVTLTTIGRAAT